MLSERLKAYYPPMNANERQCFYSLLNSLSFHTAHIFSKKQALPHINTLFYSRLLAFICGHPCFSNRVQETGSNKRQCCYLFRNELSSHTAHIFSSKQTLTHISTLFYSRLFAFICGHPCFSNTAQATTHGVTYQNGQ